MWFCVTEFVILNILKNFSAFIVGPFYCEDEDTKLSETLETAHPVTQCHILATLPWEPEIPCRSVMKPCHTKSPVKSVQVWYIRGVIQHFCSKLVQHDVVCNWFSLLIFTVLVRYLNYSHARSVTLQQSDWDICGDMKWATVTQSLHVICAIITQTITSFCCGISVSSTPMCRYVFVIISRYTGSPCLTLSGTTFHLNIDKFWWP